MPEDLFDNKYAMDFEEAVVFIKNYFEKSLKPFSLSEEYNRASGYWGIKYSGNNTVIFISSGRGYLEHEVILDGKKYLLTDFEKKLAHIKVASKKNILFLLETIKKLIDTY
ncbi:hypothetical protein [Ferruginibacter sp.]|nr:hypothetical protein [Ferruginibacter sp.]